MTPTADVIVVGAGIIGSSIAYQLARHGIEDVVVVDKGAGPAEGSTGASSSICRCRYTHPEVVRLAYHGQEAYGNWAAFTGLDGPRSGLHRVGVLWLMGETPEKVAADADKLTGEGVKAESLGADQVTALFPSLSTCSAPFDMTGGIEHVCRRGDAFLYENDGGYAEPVGANQDLIEATRRLGGIVEFDSRVVAVLKEGDRVTGVRLADGTDISAGLVVNASGPWCNQLNAMAGAELRWTLTPTRIQTVYRSWPSDLGPIPVGADASTGIYFRPESGGQQVLIGSVLAEDEQEAVEDPDDFKRVPDPGFTEMKLAAFHHRVPALEARGTVTGVAGLYTVNREDVHPVVGPTEVEGFWVANGFSGHGFKLAPAIGSMVAQAVAGTTIEFDTDVPMAYFSVEREPIDLAVKHVLA
ncbi:MAG TPA: FAD-dependent oxidoreductase [Acidimicrobiia bacterium]|nr:FAD-dependent oxidoreductase [Acidimicrobiia bacterium]